MKKKRRKVGKIYLRNEIEVDLMRQAGKVARDILLKVACYIEPGKTTADVDKYASKLIAENNCKSAFLGYRGFPGNICISINEEVVHGIGNLNRTIQNGDLVKIDVGVKKNGWVGDNALTVIAGDDYDSVPDSAKSLMFITEQALENAIKFATDGTKLGTLCNSVQEFAEANGCSVVEQLVGHGVGKRLHEEPAVPNYGKKGDGVDLCEGMILAIEPMINLGTYKVYTKPDKWTVVTKDNKLSAHFEHSVVVRKEKPEILTPRPRLTSKTKDGKILLHEPRKAFSDFIEVCQKNPNDGF